MSTVVADTSPLNYLVQCEAIEVLPKLYDEIFIPRAVLDEISNAGAPQSVRLWVESRPSWFSIRSPNRIDRKSHLGVAKWKLFVSPKKSTPMRFFSTSAVTETSHRAVDFSFLERLAFSKAAAKRDLLKLSEAVKKLEQTNFRIDRSLLKEVLEREARRLEERAHQPERDRGIER